MFPVIAIVIAVLVCIIGIVIYQIALKILDEGDYFFYVVGFFLTLFLVCAVALYFFLPRPKSAELVTIIPAMFTEGSTAFDTNASESSIVFSSR